MIAVGSLILYTEVIKPQLDSTRDQFAEDLGDVLAAASPPRILSFQGRLTDSSGDPVTSATDVVFKIYDARTGGTLLWTSKTWSVTPDSNGIFSVCLGGQDTTDDCLLNGVADTAIPSTLFSENAALYLGVTAGSDSEMTPRQRIASVSYALNSDTLDGFHGSQSPGANQVPVLDGSGNLAFAGAATISTGSSGALTLDSASGTVGLGSGDLFLTTGQTSTFTSSTSLITADNVFVIGASTGTFVQMDAQSLPIHTGDITGAGKLIGVRSLFDDIAGNTSRRTLASVRNFESSLTTISYAQAGITITNYAGLWIIDPEMDGGANDTIITNPYGIYIEDFSTSEGGTFTNTPRAIYQAGTDDYNILAGQTRIGGTSDPASGIELDVTGDANVSGSYYQGGTQGITANCGASEFLQDPTVSGGIVTAGTCASAGGSGESFFSFLTSTKTGAGYQFSATGQVNSNSTDFTPNNTDGSVQANFAGYVFVTATVNFESYDDSTTVTAVEVNGSVVAQDRLSYSNDETDIINYISQTVTWAGAVADGDDISVDIPTLSGATVNNDGTAGEQAGTLVVQKIRTGADVAEMYPTADPTLNAGDVVSIDPSLRGGVKKSDKQYDSQVLGVVSTLPSLVIGSPIGTGSGPHHTAVALTGRVPVKVSGENGPIEPGDLLTSSSTPGVGMKATRAGYVIGRALTSLSCPGVNTSEVDRTVSPDGGNPCQGTVVVFVGTHYANPAQLDESGDLSSTFDWDLENEENLKALAKLRVDKDNNIVTSISDGSRFIWENSLGEAVAWVNSAGEAFFQKVTATVADFGKLVFGEAVVKKEAKTAGEASFQTNETEVLIRSDKVTEDSLINLTPTTKTGGVSLYVKEKKPGEGFVVALERNSGDLPDQATASATQAIKFTWFILNQE
ncbi:MAG: hypothetical protein WD187_03020 [Candidatus Woykebacteria bacterium]